MSFSNDIIDYSNSEYESAAGRIRSSLASSDSRYRASWEDDATNVPIVKLKNIVIGHAVSSVELIKKGGNVTASDLTNELDALNCILSDSGFDIQVFIDKKSNVMVKNTKYEPMAAYHLSKMSDGEKNAVIMCCHVLCADEGALIVLDEPERHLHKRIVSSLLFNLIDRRKDCAFIISTHELTLPSFFKKSTVVSVFGCQYKKKMTSYGESESVSWDVSIISDYNHESNDIDEQVKIDVLGARNKILFVEGVQSSLDVDLYSAIFENISVISKAKCDLVELAVKGLRGNDFAHWVDAVGIIDNDNKVEKQIKSLNAEHVFSLSVHSIESIYYHPEMIRFVISAVKDVNGIDSVDECFDRVCNVIHGALLGQRNHLCCRAIEKKIRAEIMSSIPTQKNIQQGGVYKKEIDFSTFLKEELSIFDALIEQRDYKQLISRYPIRETPLLKPIAEACGFADRKRYELNVVRVVKNNRQAREFVYSLLGGAAEAILR